MLWCWSCREGNAVRRISQSALFAVVYCTGMHRRSAFRVKYCLINRAEVITRLSRRFDANSETFVSNCESVERVNGVLCGLWIVVTDKSKTFTNARRQIALDSR